MSRSKRTHGTGAVYIEYGSYYGRWLLPGGGRTNRKLAPSGDRGRPPV